MTSIQSAKPATGSAALSEIYVEFDGRQLTLSTDVPEVREFYLHTFSAMVVPRRTSDIGRLDFLRTESGYAIRGLRERDFGLPLDHLFETLKAEILFHFVSSRRDLLWVHAGGVEQDGRALLFAGPSGNGKSTLVTRLCERGRRFLSDDIAPIRMDADVVYPFPQTPRRRIHPGRVLPPSDIGVLERESVTMDAGRIQRAPTPIGGIVFPSFQEGAAKLHRVAGGDAALKLIRDCTNFADHKAAAVARAVDMARTIPVYELTYSSGLDAAKLFDSMS